MHAVAVVEYFSVSKVVENNFEPVVPTEERCTGLAVEVDPVIVEKKGTVIGPPAKYFAIGEESFARTVNHAPTLHGLGVATVALVYDECDPEPVNKPNPLTK